MDRVGKAEKVMRTKCGRLLGNRKSRNFQKVARHPLEKSFCREETGRKNGNRGNKLTTVCVGPGGAWTGTISACACIPGTAKDPAPNSEPKSNPLRLISPLPCLSSMHFMPDAKDAFVFCLRTTGRTESIENASA